MELVVLEQNNDAAILLAKDIEAINTCVKVVKVIGCNSYSLEPDFKNGMLSFKDKWLEEEQFHYSIPLVELYIGDMLVGKYSGDPNKAQEVFMECLEVYIDTNRNIDIFLEVAADIFYPLS